MKSNRNTQTTSKGATPTSRRSPGRPALVVALAVSAGATTASAAVFSWDGGDPDDSNWTSPDNWTTSAPPNDGTADIRLPYNLASEARYSISVDSPQTINSLLFQNSGSATNTYILSGAKITIDSEAGSPARGILVQRAGVTASITSDVDFSRATQQSISGTLNTVLQFGGTVTASGADSLLYVGTAFNQTIELLPAGTLDVASFTLQNAASSGAAAVTLKLNDATSLIDSMVLNLVDSTAVSTQAVRVDLNFSGTEVVSGLTINSAAMAAGAYGAIGSGAQFEDTHFSGTGVLQVIPEPASLVLLSASGLLALQRPRRSGDRLTAIPPTFRVGRLACREYEPCVDAIGFGAII